VQLVDEEAVASLSLVHPLHAHPVMRADAASRIILGMYTGRDLGAM